MSSSWYRLVDQADVQQVDPITRCVLPDRKTVYGKFAYIPMHGRYGTGKEVLVDASDLDKIAKHHKRWTLTWDGYPQAWSRMEKRMVRLYWFILDEGIPAGMEIDHLNQDRLDNRAVNLAIKTRSANGMNRGNRGACEYKGVCFNKASGKYQAEINIDGKKKYLGLFHTPEAARDAYNAAAAKRARDMKDGEGQAPVKIQKTINNYFGTVNIANNA